MTDAVPTLGHKSLVELVQKGLVKLVVSTNVDGLHMKSGLAKENLSELHGNIYIERCEKCKTEYQREHDVREDDSNNGPSVNHFTGRYCEKGGCNGKLNDTIVNFGEFLDSPAFELAGQHAWKSDLAIVLGTSMRVAPANQLPQWSFRKNEGHLVICNLQKTPFDSFAHLKLAVETDDFFYLLLKELELDISGVALPEVNIDAKYQELCKLSPNKK